MRRVRSQHFAALVTLVAALVTANTASAGPFGIPPLKEDPLLAKVAPEKCLWYLSWAGSATPEADSENHLEALLAEKEVQQLIKVVEEVFVRAMNEETRRDPTGQMAANEALKVVKSMIHRPTAFFVGDVKPGARGSVAVRGGMVMHAGDDLDMVKKAIRTLHNETPLKAVLKDVEINGTTWTQFPGDGPVPPVTLGFIKRYLVIGVGEGEGQAIVKRAATPAPEWLTMLKKNLAVERPSITSYVNLATIREMALSFNGEFAEPAKLLGLDQLNSLSSVIGLDGPDTVSKTLIGLDGEPAGLFALAGDKPLALGDLALIPKDSTVALAVRMDAKKLVLQLLELVGRFDENAQEEIIEGLEQAEDALGFSVADDLLGSLGDVWTAYSSPADGGAFMTGMTGAVTVKDKKKLAEVLDKLAAMAKAQGVLGPVTGRDRRPMSIRSTEYKGHRILYMTSSDRVFPPVFSPALCLTDTHLIVSAYPQHIKSFIDRDASKGGLASNPEVATAFKQGAPFKLFYHDTKHIFEMVYPLLKIGASAAASELAREGIQVDITMLPALPTISKHLVSGTMAVRKTSAGFITESRNSIPGDFGFGALGPLMVGVGIPAVSSARTAAQETASASNLRQIALAMHNNAAATSTFPARAISDKDGKPLLSWRVQILPYIEEGALYREFKLDEPWDSEHNKKLIARMPRIYRAPTSRAAPGHTTYVVPAGKDTAFSGTKGPRAATIKDGMSKTIMAVQVNDSGAVPWTKPDDLDTDAEGWTMKLRSRTGNFPAVFFDGAAQRIPNEMIGDGKMLKAVFTHAAGDSREADQFFEFLFDGGRGVPRARVRDEARDEAIEEVVPDDFPSDAAEERIERRRGE